MDSTRLAHFKKLLLDELRQHAGTSAKNRPTQLMPPTTTPRKPLIWLCVTLMSELALRLGERESQMIADIDQALLRIKEGSYGVCGRCNRPIEDRRLEAMPTARYDSACQSSIENEKGDLRPTL
jgi:DnaK suppressor protein